MSTWEDGLRRLYRATPSQDIQSTVINIMRGPADDRSAALAAAAMADTGLMAGILAVPPQPKGVEALFWAKKAKYPTFDKRIRKATQLGLIGPQTEKNLRVIRLVRNVFAHAMVEVTFTTPEIVAACHEIVLSPNAQFFVDQESQREIRYRFCYGCDPVFRGLLGFLARPFIFGTPPIKPSQPILP